MGDTHPSPEQDRDRSGKPGERRRDSWIAPGSSDVVDAPVEASSDAEPNRGRRIISRIPGLSRLSEQSGWAEGERAPSDPGWVFHEADGPEGFEGWLFHYADGAMVDADGIAYAFPDEPAEPEAAEQEAEQEPVPEPEPEPEPAPESHLSVVAAPPEPEPEAEVEPEAEPEAEPPADAEPEPAPEPTAAEPEPEVEVERPSDIPRFVEYSPTHLRGYLLGAVFLVASVTGVLTLFVAVRDDSSAALVIAGGCMVLALVAWWALLGWKPTVVTIREGVLDITRGGHSEQFELTDPSTVVEFGGSPGSPRWTATIRNKNGPRTVLRSSHVKPRQFERIARHYRPRAEPTRPDEAASS
jgi:hypothetical protein